MNTKPNTVFSRNPYGNDDAIRLLQKYGNGDAQCQMDVRFVERDSGPETQIEVQIIRFHAKRTVRQHFSLILAPDEAKRVAEAIYPRAAAVAGHLFKKAS